MSNFHRFIALSALALIVIATIISSANVVSAIEIDDEQLEKAVDKATDLLKSQNMSISLTDEQRAQIKEKMGRMAKQFGGFGGGYGGRGNSRLLEILLFFLSRRGGFGGNNNPGGGQVVFVPAPGSPAAPAAPATTSPFDLISLITLLGLALLLIMLLPTGF